VRFITFSQCYMNQNVKLAEVSNTWKFASTSLNLLMGGAYLSIWTNSAFAAVLRDCQCLFISTFHHRSWGNSVTIVFDYRLDGRG